MARSYKAEKEIIKEEERGGGGKPRWGEEAGEEGEEKDTEMKMKKTEKLPRNLHKFL